MKKIFLCLLVMIALLSAPIAHASGLDCQGDNASKISKEDNSKAEKISSGHDCCTHNVSYFSTQEVKFFAVSAIQGIHNNADEQTESFIAGPPLKPPSQV